MKEAEALLPMMILRRRDLHKYPEAGWLEMRTTSRIARELSDLGYSVFVGDAVTSPESRMGVPDNAVISGHYEWAAVHGADPEFLSCTRGGATGVIAELHCGEGPVCALRFDLDALGVSERQDSGHRPAAEAFSSSEDGIMHACGHDGHIAVGLAVARLLVCQREAFRGTVRLIFQPAEEGVRGAKSVADAGWLDDADYLLGGHIVPAGGSGAKVAMIADGGPVGLATAKYDFEFLGKAAHAGTSPQDGQNALLAAASAVLQMHAIPRSGNAMTQINVGRMTAGTGRNVICDRALIEMEVRGETTEACRYMEEYAVRIAEGCAQIHGCRLNMQKMGSAPVLENTADLQKFVIKLCGESGIPVVTALKSEGSSEDFAWLAAKVHEHGGQSLYMGFPCECAAPNHDTGFDFDESVMVTAAGILAGCAAALLAAGQYGTPRE